MDLDGDLDAWVVRASGERRLNDGTGRLSPAGLAPPTDATLAVLDDLDGDDRPDVVEAGSVARILLSRQQPGWVWSARTVEAPTVSVTAIVDGEVVAETTFDVAICPVEVAAPSRTAASGGATGRRRR